MQQNIVVRFVFGLSVGFLIAIAAIQVSERYRPDSNDELVGAVLGRPDFEAYCRDSGATERRAILTTNDASGWRCAGFTDGLWSSEPPDISAVCVEQFGSGSFPQLFDETSPEGWLCIRAD